MSRDVMTVDEDVSSPALLLSLARRAQRVLSSPAGSGAEERDPQELQVLLQQVAQLQNRFHSPRPTDLQRWLERVRQLVEDRRRLSPRPFSPPTR